MTFTKTGENSSEITGKFKPDNGNEADFQSGNIPNTNGTLTLTVTPDDGYEVEGWYVNGTEQDNSARQNIFKYPVTHDVGAAIQVKIIRSSYAVNFSAVNGNIAATKPTNVAIESGDLVQGDTSVTFTATPAQPTGYTFDGWKINGETADQYNEATVNNQSLSLVIKEPVRVAATYTQDVTRHTVTYGVDGETLAP
ncbi:MAG: InlB B-repeat-containing protein [Evtepia sp.]